MVENRKEKKNLTRPKGTKWTEKLSRFCAFIGNFWSVHKNGRLDEGKQRERERWAMKWNGYQRRL